MSFLFRIRLQSAVAALLMLGMGFTWAAQPVQAHDPYAKHLKQYRRPAKVPFPEDNRYTIARYELGKMLFFDPRLSGSNILSCASCHNPAFSWGDGLPRAVGHGMNELGRRTPTVLNLAWGDAYFWDGRAGSLEEQALGPIQAEGEMNLPLDKMIEKLEGVQGYRPYFAKAYPKEGLTAETVGKAIATFERMIVSSRSPFDRWVAGDTRAVSREARQGFLLFNTKANCSKCHGGWNFTDGSFHDIGLPGMDEGRGAVLTSVASMKFAFKTPTLRNVDRRAPYMHDGSVSTLREVIDFYDRGGEMRRASLSPEIKPLQLTEAEKESLVAFLRTLTSDDPQMTVPTLPR